MSNQVEGKREGVELRQTGKMSSCSPLPFRGPETVPAKIPLPPAGEGGFPYCYVLSGPGGSG